MFQNKYSKSISKDKIKCFNNDLIKLKKDLKFDSYLIEFNKKFYNSALDLDLLILNKDTFIQSDFLLKKQIILSIDDNEIMSFIKANHFSEGSDYIITSNSFFEGINSEYVFNPQSIKYILINKFPYFVFFNSLYSIHISYNEYREQYYFQTHIEDTIFSNIITDINEIKNEIVLNDRTIKTLCDDVSTIENKITDFNSIVNQNINAIHNSIVQNKTDIMSILSNILMMCNYIYEIYTHTVFKKKWF